MFDQSYGLRFDIYERIILAEDLPGIEELEEVELIPHIQVISQEEQATLRGHLLLAGVYKGDSEEGESEPLEHWIPVEITVPLNRVSSLEDIAVEIENFDVDLLSKRSLNITGVLSLKGIQASAVQGTNEQAWNDEEITVVHAPEASSEQSYESDLRELQQTEYQADYFPAYPLIQDQGANVYGQQINEENLPLREQHEEFQSAPYSFGYVSDEQTGSENGEVFANDEGGTGASEQELHRDQASQEIPFTPSAEPLKSEPEISPQASNIHDSSLNVWNFERVEQHNNSDAISSAETSSVIEERQEDAISEIQTAFDEVEASSEEKLDIAAVQESALLTEEPSTSEEPPVKQEMKVAFSTKNSTVDNTAGIGFSSLLQSKRTLQEQETAAREAADPVLVETEQPGVEDVQWKSLFLGSRQEETPFRKVRLCIVQREETIDAIAERYQLSPRELLLYNRLAEQSLEEGQVLYIP